MSLAAETRAAVRARPFLYEALRAGVVNYAAAARVLDVAEDTDAVATALRRFSEGLPPRETAPRKARVTMHGGLAPEADEPLLSVGDARFGEAPDGPLTGVLATGDVDPTALAETLGVLAAHGVEPQAAGVAEDSLLLVVERRDGPGAVQYVEEALEAVPAKARG